MKDTVTKFLRDKKDRSSRRRKAVSVLLALSLVVATGTTWSLHQTGESLSGETYCGIPEHTHTDECKEKVLVCDLEETGEGHTHTEECYETQQTLTCTQAEHTHSAENGCYAEESVLVCGLEESEEHTHTEECYETQQVLICETPEHTHSVENGCYTEEQVLVCGQEESETGHTHTEECYEEKLTCGFEEEHTHTLACYSNPDADVESASVWEQTVAGVTLTGDAGKDVVAIARTQLGYHESTQNYKVEKAADGTEKTKGYTRYGAWYGSAYEDWCAMFASFCIHYANVDYPLDAGCPSWISTLSASGRYAAKGSWTPAIGDLVFFDQNGDGTSDHVGIVSALTSGGSSLAEDADTASVDGIYVIEGNCNDQVAEQSYSLGDGTIVGYGVLPVKEKESGNETETEAAVENVKTAQCDKYTVTVTYGDDAGIPEGAELAVSEEDAVSTQEELAELLDTSTTAGDAEGAVGEEEATENSAADSKTVSSLARLEIGFTLDGEEIEPAEGSTVQVQIAVTGGLEMPEGSELNIIHHKNDGTSEVIGNVEVTDGEDSTLSFSTDSFSVYDFVLTSDSDGEEGIDAQADDDSDYSYTVGLSSGVVNFYIAYDSENQDASDASTWVTTGVTTTMYGSSACQSTLGSMTNNGEVLYSLGSDGATGTTAASNDKTIREAVTGTFTVKRNNTTYNIKISSFPDDETILSAVRAKNASITVGGTTYQASDLTEDNFDIRWIVVKYNGGDGWHVDGILVRKEASLTVKKTFAGDTDAISAVTGSGSSYKITVGEKEYSLSDATKSEDGSTYTWVVTGLTPGSNYTVTESGYEATNYLVSSSYAVTNSSAAANDGSGTGASATAKAVQSYSSAEDPANYQTVAFTNVYTKPYTMTILKRDSTSQNPLSGVKFDLTVTKSGGSAQTSVITSGPDGIAAIDFSSEGLGGEGNYTFSLKEQANQGYEALPEVTGTVTVDSDGKVTVSNLSGGVVGNNTLVSIDTTTNATIYIDNKAERAKVTVTKTWDVTDDDDKLPVTVQLLRNGTAVAEKSAQLSSSNSWTVTWDDLPYYVDGAVAYYTVRETWIGTPGATGSTAYNTDADATDGYADYIVSQSTVSGTEQATDSSGNTYTVYTSSVSLTNTPDNGQVVITKVEKGTRTPLSGAEFTVYSDAACQTAVTNGAFTSGTDGKVTISGLSAGTYYVKETIAPEGYALQDTVYTLMVKSRNSTLTLDGNTVSSITNEKLYVDLKLTKTDDSTTGNKKTLSGAEFTLKNGSGQYYTENNGTVAWSGTETARATGSDGTLSFGDLPAGSYTLTETKAPDGYKASGKTITITVSNTGVTASWAGGESITVTAVDGVYTFSVPNSTGYALPSTGGPGTILYTLGGLSLMAAALVYGCQLRRRRERRCE